MAGHQESKPSLASRLPRLRAAADVFLFFVLTVGVAAGARALVVSGYALPLRVQETALRWALLADEIGRAVDLPREVPLALWYAENGMQAENPAGCRGIVGAGDNESGCYAPGRLDADQVAEQLALGAQRFKSRCPEVTYGTADPALLKRCYLAYHAGEAAAVVLDPDQSPYVMDGYDAAHRDLVYRELAPGRLGAWPAHLALQALIVANWDQPQAPRPVLWVERAWLDWRDRLTRWGPAAAQPPEGDQPVEGLVELCLVVPHAGGAAELAPAGGPLAGQVTVSQRPHGCRLALPGVDLASANVPAPLLAPLAGELTTYLDGWGNCSLRIENQEWIVWLIHGRTCTAGRGWVERGEQVGVLGVVGDNQVPFVHYAVYDRLAAGFVDPEPLLWPPAEGTGQGGRVRPLGQLSHAVALRSDGPDVEILRQGGSYGHVSEMRQFAGRDVLDDVWSDVVPGLRFPGGGQGGGPQSVPR